MCLYLSISDTLVGTLAETRDNGFVAELDALEWTEAVEPIKFGGSIPCGPRDWGPTPLLRIP